MSKDNYIIEAKGLVKKFGFKTVLRKIDLSLKKGDFLTLFGPNGAGKTTLIQILCSLMQPTSGRVFIAGFDTRYDREALHKVIGVISHNTFLYNNLSAYENLKFYGKMYQVMNLKERIEEVIELVGLRGYMDDHVQTFSRGMQQRLSVARAIIHNPLIFFLDEPFTGLDQHGVEDFKQLLRKFRDQGKTIVMASHDLDRGLELCTQAAILKSGTLVYKENVSKIIQDDFKEIYFNCIGISFLDADERRF
ncbi:MAG: heme ABC exporter ATP-binding protein CcmA [Desulfobacteria bacterium]